LAESSTKPATADESQADDAARGRLAKGRRRLSFASAASILGGLLLWELAGRFLVRNSLFLATPTQIVEEIIKLAASGELQLHMYTSSQEFFIGLAIAIVLGIAVGFITASSRLGERTLGPWVTALYATPTIAISPLIILWAGIGIWSKVIVVVINSIFPMIINTDAGLRATDKHLLDAARCFGASRWQLFWKVSLPAAIPFVLAGIRLAVGRGLVAVVVAELFGARAGLGYLLVQASEVFNMPRLFAAVVILAVTGIVLTWLVGRAERYLLPWRFAGGDSR